MGSPLTPRRRSLHGPPDCLPGGQVEEFAIAEGRIESLIQGRIRSRSHDINW